MNVFDDLNSGSEQDFHHSVVAIQASRRGGYHGVGSDTLPKHEALRFKVPQNLGFPGKALAKVVPPESVSQPYQVYVNFMGLTGPSGVLPSHYSEWVMERCKQKDESMRDFLDIFHHRIISLYHRAWEKYQYPLQYLGYLQTRQSDPISSVLHTLAGTSSDSQLYFGGMFAQGPRSAQALKQIVQLLSACKVSINERVGQWFSLNAQEQSQLGGRLNPEGQHAQLGKNATLGSKIWDIGSAVEIEIHADNSTAVQRLLPGEPLLTLLQQTVTAYLPNHILPRWTLTACYRDMPAGYLGQTSFGLGRGAALSVSSCRMEHYSKVAIA